MCPRDPPTASEWGAESRIAAIRRWRPQSVVAGQDHTRLLLKGAHLRRGLQVLDLGCGAGEPALAESRRVGPRGHVTGVDPSEALVALAMEYAREEGLGQVEFRVATAEELPFRAGNFDRVTCRFGAMYFTDLPRAISEARRVLRPGGRLAWLVWGPIEQPFFQATVFVALRHARMTHLPPETAQPFCFGRGGVLSRALVTGGFEEVRENLSQVTWSWPGSPEEVCALWLSGAPPFRGILDALDPDARTRAVAEITERLGDYHSKNRVNVPERVVLATGVRGADSAA